MVKFIAGRALENKNRWQEAVDKIIDGGGHVPKCVVEAIKNGAFNIRHADFTNHNANNFVFRGQKFRSKTKLMSAHFANSRSVSENKREVELEVENLVSSGAIREVSEEEATSAGSIVSPILWITQRRPDGSRKNRLIHHDRCNYTYSRPRFSLTQISAELDMLAEFEEIAKWDLDKAFYTSGVDPWFPI